MRILSTPLVLGLLTSLTLGQHSGPATEVQSLELREPIEKELAAGEVHSYSARVTAGQVLDLVVEQRGVDVVVNVSAPDGKKVTEVDSPNGADGPELVLLAVEATGNYIVQVRALENGASGRYAITFNDRRPPTDRDRKHFADVAKLAEAQRIENQWAPLYDEGRYDEAIQLAEKALAIYEKALSVGHPSTATVVKTLTVLHIAKGDYARSDSFQRRWLAILAKEAGSEEHIIIADSLTYLSVFYFERGEYERAALLLQRALPIVEKEWGTENKAYAMVVNNLAEVYSAKGDYASAEPLYQRSLAIREKILGREHPDVAIVLNNLAGLYLVKGDYARAEPLYVRSVAIIEKELGEDHPNLAKALNNLAVLYSNRGDNMRAEQLYQRSLEIREKAFGPVHPDVANSLNNLALLYWQRGDFVRSVEFYQRILTIFEKRSNGEHPFVATVLNNLATLFWNGGEYARAEPLYQRSLMILEKTLGAEHPDIATVLSNQAVMYRHRGDFARVLALTQRATEIEEKNIALILTTGSQQEKQSYLNTLLGETYSAVSLNVRDMSGNSDAARLALNVILQRKGRVLDAMSDQITSLRRRANPEDQRLLEQLFATRSRLATLQLSSAGNLSPEARRSEIARLEAEQDRMEGDISRRSAEFRAIAQPVTLDAVRQVMPPDAALVELFVYYPFITKTAGQPLGAPQYVAYILRRTDAVPQWVELGDAASINNLVGQLHSALRDPKREDFNQLARTLDERVMRPVRKLLGPMRRIFLAPDGALNLIPFASLVDEKGQYLIENYTINYLTSGRDLLRLQAAGEERTGAASIVANPQFDLTRPDVICKSARREGELLPDASDSKVEYRATDFTLLCYSTLNGTAQEATQIHSLLPGALVVTRKDATEAVLKGLRRPRVLHIATHGFFLTDKVKEPPAGGRLLRGTFDTLDQAPLPAGWENPLLRSGLVLAGVKQAQSGAGEDGVLTALEVAGLDLWGTKLVVLSACETGLGGVKNGEGVYGLRRALVLAGSETQVMSLWKVSDSGTRDLMTAYYKRLQASEGRTEALRHVQLAMLRGELSAGVSERKRETRDIDEKAVPKDYRHPYYWAAFIPSGDWRSMDGK
jgi:CHAT domain-containing protein/Tfp pilus assembly protein PilF